MIRFIFDINGVKTKAVMPEQWEEVTLQQVMDLNHARKTDKTADPLLLFAALSGQKLSELNNTPTNLFEPFLDHLKLLSGQEPKWVKLKHPDEIRLNSKTIKVPKDLGFERFGQKVLGLDILERYNKEKEDLDKLDSLPEILALYFQPLYDGKFDRNRVDTVKKYVLNMKALQAVPIANFFLDNLLKSNNIGLLGLNPWALMWTNKLRGLTQIQNGLTNLVHYN